MFICGRYVLDYIGIVILELCVGVCYCCGFVVNGCWMFEGG